MVSAWFWLWRPENPSLDLLGGYTIWRSCGVGRYLQQALPSIGGISPSTEAHKRLSSLPLSRMILGTCQVRWPPLAPRVDASCVLLHIVMEIGFERISQHKLSRFNARNTLSSIERSEIFEHFLGSVGLSGFTRFRDGVCRKSWLAWLRTPLRGRRGFFNSCRVFVLG